jgi:hypothetical protein
VCGSRLPSSANSDELVAVPAGLLDGDPGVKPEINIHVESAASWHSMDESMASVEGQGSGVFWREYMEKKSSEP